MKITPFVTLVFALGIAIGANAQQGRRAPASGGRKTRPRPLRMSIPGFADGSQIPLKYTCVAKGHGVSPAVRWSQVPAGTKSFILLVQDPEAHPGRGTQDVTHWMIWNIPGNARGLPEGVPAGLTLPDGAHQVQGRGGPTGVYFGPCAPPGPNHHYMWELYALDTKLNLPKTATREQVMAAANGHILSTAVWIGLFHR